MASTPISSRQCRSDCHSRQSIFAASITRLNGQRAAVAIAYFALVIFLGHQTFMALDRVEALAK